MTFDLLGSIELTAGAAVALAILSINLGETTRARLRLALLGAAWFAAVTALAAAGVLTNAGALGLPMLGLAVLAPVAVLAVAGRRIGPFSIASQSRAVKPLRQEPGGVPRGRLGSLAA